METVFSFLFFSNALSLCVTPSHLEILAMKMQMLFFWKEQLGSEFYKTRMSQEKEEALVDLTDFKDIS